MSEFDQVARRQARALLFVESDPLIPRSVGRLKADERDRDGDPLKSLVSPLLRRDHHDTVDALREEGIQCFRDAGVVLMGERAEMIA